MSPTIKQDKVIPESFRIILRQYLGKPEVKSLAPDGTPCAGTTQGLLLRAKIAAGKLIPVGKETDRRWEQGEDPSMVDSDIYIYEKRMKLVIADSAERKRFAAIGLRRLARESKLSLQGRSSSNALDHSANGRQAFHLSNSTNSINYPTGYPTNRELTIRFAHRPTSRTVIVGFGYR